MSRSEDDFQVGTVLVTGGFIWFGGFVVALGIELIYDVLSYAHPEWAYNSGSILMGGIIIMFIVAPVIAVAIEQERVKKIEEAAQRAFEANAQRQIELRAEEMKRLEESITRNATRAVELFNTLPGLAESAERHRDEARNHYRAGAFSPFWASIERAYESLGKYNNSLLELNRMAVSHPVIMQSYRARYGSKVLPDFPIDINSANAARVGEVIADNLGRLVYEAQRQAVFAQIWEQRRTTSVLISGFRNLEQAVAGLHSALSASLRDLTTAIHDGQTGMVDAIRTNNSAISTAASSSDRNLRELNSSVSKATWYLNDHYQREFGWRL